MTTKKEVSKKKKIAIGGDQQNVLEILQFTR